MSAITKLSLICTQITTQMINGKTIYSVTLQYQTSAGTNQMVLDSTEPFKFVIGQAYTASFS